MFRVIADGPSYREHVLLKDGQGVLLRPATPLDTELVRELTRRASRESLRLRFMAAVSEVPDSIIEQLCNGDFVDSGCLLAVVSDDGGERVVGLGNYVGGGNGRGAEVAFLVEDAYQGRGISTLLLEKLAGLAAANGLVELEAEVLPENRAMLAVFEGSGFAVHRVWGTDTVHVELPVDRAGALRERADLRERIAVANSLVPLLKPKTVAVVGASRDSGSLGNLLFRHVLSAGFAGTVFPVNPQANSVHGVKAFPSLLDVPEPIDVAVVAVPAEGVLEVVENAAKVGVRGLVVVSAGFAEAGAEGAERQRRLVEVVRGHGVRLIGPSCLGLMNSNPEVHLNATLAPSLAPRGSVGFFSHSAALGLVILEHAAERGIGFSTFISAGNRADVSGNDLLQYWEEDPDTEVALLYLETFGNPRRFARIARRVSMKKPILCVKGARSRAGQRTAQARSGLPGTTEVEVEALFDQTGVIRAETLDELFDVAVLLAHQPLPRGKRVAVIANSAGVATLMADASEANGLEIAGPGVVNLGAFTTSARYEHEVEGALRDDEVDSVLLAYACVGDCDPEAVKRAISRGVAAARSAGVSGKPVLLCIMGEIGAVATTIGEERLVFPAYRFPEAAPRALGRVVRYAEFRRRPAGQLAWYDDVDGGGARRTALAALGEAAETTLAAEAAAEFLGLAGIETGDVGEGGVALRVRHDPLFGPLLELAPAGSEPVERITPLTDRDLADLLVAAGLPNDDGIAAVCGRISQLVEEVPWLWSLEAVAATGAAPLVAAGAVVRLRRAPAAGAAPAREESDAGS